LLATYAVCQTAVGSKETTIGENIFGDEKVTLLSLSRDSRETI